MPEILRTTFQVRRGYEEAWQRNNPILACGEPGFVIDKNVLKIGDGVTPWNELKYVNSSFIIDGDDIVFPPASESTPGAVKLYDSTGQNVDGTLTQKAITEELSNKVSLTLREDDELIIFSL